MELDTALALANPTVPDMELIALAPADLLAAQTDLVNWCQAKTTALHDEVAELRENVRIAKASKWRVTGLQNALKRAERRVTYYDKIKAAVEAGYLIVPNFPVDVFAVRVSRERPRQTIYNSRWARHEASPDALPAGEGRYVNAQTVQRDESYTDKGSNGATTEVVRLIDDAYADVAFPVQAVKPVVMDATQRAMALRIFDQIGIVHNQGGIAAARRGDPIIVGQLQDPRGNGRGVTFFIAWWLDTRQL